ncbi:MAG: pyrroline-5-carboxylate reductase [Thermomicrobiales bacterium]|nr:pyrroline-5-carboxylate reductase [Thermomicrobiales bacterium]MCO5219415.1 pyrroline-5-carboxylate reductase [Thermomicrobiales bacterium]MCO5225195.1 pyrroline-5-carboxylate reductase [Thermomicrobiales bacterium]MCO5227017.1 pyrroline-5-carboxylate reductase [Thermomicrobiales bacterium]
MGDSTLADTRIAIVGAGVMAEAMLAGLFSREMIPQQQITASHPREDRRIRLEAKHGIRVVASNAEAARDADLILLTIKPQVMQTVMAELAEVLQPHQIVISIAAGTSVAQLQNGLNHKPIVRVMPNTPAQIGEGMAVWYAVPEVGEAARNRVRLALGALGLELEVEHEKYVDMATALSGTGPTYVFMMMEALIDAGVHMGFPRRIAEQIVMQTVGGSVSYARESGKHLAELRNMVTSPGGTSAEAIYQMEKGGLRTILSKSVYAAYKRTQSLAKEG